MAKVPREFQVFVKPIGSICNLACKYCYYLEKQHLYPKGESFTMPDNILEEYIIQHIRSSSGQVIHFSWHGGEPTVLGLDYFRKIVAMQKKHQPPDQAISNGIQTNGTLINEDWCRFFKEEDFMVGLSLDGPREMHDRHRVTKSGNSTHKQALRGYKLLQQYRVPCDILCVVNSFNVNYPTQVYRYFKELKAGYIGFLPLVEHQPDKKTGVSDLTVPPEALGDFLCTIFDEWKERDIGRVTVQLFEEVARTALGHDHALCIFRKTCGDFPVVEHNGDFFACDHYVEFEYRLGNILNRPMADMIESPFQRAFGEAKWKSLPRYCLDCEVLSMCHGGCPKNRFIPTPNGEKGLNYLCEGYKHFFYHCRPFVRGLVSVQNLRSKPADQAPKIIQMDKQIHSKIGRNDPCPCGSGKKYKKCCMNK